MHHFPRQLVRWPVDQCTFFQEANVLFTDQMVSEGSPDCFMLYGIKCLLEFYPEGLWKHGATNSELALEGTTFVNFVASLTSHKVSELRQILHLLL